MERKIGDKYTDKNGVERTLLSAADYNWNALTKSSKNYLDLTVLRKPFATKDGETIELYPEDCKYLLYNDKRVKEIGENETEKALVSIAQEGRAPSKVSKTGISTLTACFLTKFRDVEKPDGTFTQRVAHSVPKDYVTFVKYKLPNIVRLTANVFAERDKDGYAISDATIKQPVEVKKTMARVVALLEKYPNVYPLLPVQLQTLEVIQDAFVEGKKQEKIITNVVRPDNKKLRGTFREKNSDKSETLTLPGDQFFAKKLTQPNSASKMRKFVSNVENELNVKPTQITLELLGDELTKARADVEALSKQPAFEPKEKSTGDEYLESLANDKKEEQPTKVEEKQSEMEIAPNEEVEDFDDIDDIPDINYDDDDVEGYEDMPF